MFCGQGITDREQETVPLQRGQAGLPLAPVNDEEETLSSGKGNQKDREEVSRE